MAAPQTLRDQLGELEDLFDRISLSPEIVIDWFRNHPHINVNTAIDREGFNALMLAIKTNNIPLINALLRYGADINQPTSQAHGKRTPLMVAVYQYMSLPAMERLAFSSRMKLPLGSESVIRPDAVELLLARGADRYAKDYRGRTALDQAIEDESNDIIAILSRDKSAGGRKSKKRRRMQRRRRRSTRKMKHRK